LYPKRVSPLQSLKNAGEARINVDRHRLNADESNSLEPDYVTAPEYATDNPSELADASYLKLLDQGYGAVVAYFHHGQLFVANCGGCMAVLSRNGKAVPLSVKHSLFASTAGSTKLEDAFNNTSSVGAEEKKSRGSALDEQQQKNQNMSPSMVQPTASSSPATNTTNLLAFGRAWNASRRELIRVRHSGGAVSHEGFVGDQENSPLHTRSFGYFRQSPQIHAAPHVSWTALQEQDEFVIIGSASFWRTMTYQTAVEIASLKADDPLEASMVLRDFALAYAKNAMYSVDKDTELPEDQLAMREHHRYGMLAEEERRRYFLQHPITVIVLELRQWVGGKRKVFKKTKRRKDETLDSVDRSFNINIYIYIYIENITFNPRSKISSAFGPRTVQCTEIFSLRRIPKVRTV
jgi:serine/threonine protein phosphatase PrpC